MSTCWLIEVTELVVVDVADSHIAPVGERTGTRILRAVAADVGEVVDEFSTLLVVASARHGVPLAKGVHLVARDVPVIFLTESTARQHELAATLAITPGISRHTKCFVADRPETTEALIDEIDRRRLRVAHRRTLNRMQSSLGQLADAPPELLSRYLRQLFDQAPVGILVTDRNGIVQAANQGSTRMLGWQPRQTVGSAFFAIFPDAALSSAQSLITDCVDRNDTVETVLTRTGPDGSTQHLQVSAAPVDRERPDLGVIILLSDESMRVRALELADQARAVAEAAAQKYATLAATLQESLLPPHLPDIAGVDIAAYYHPAGDGSQIGGDFYDVFQVANDEWYAVIGDVCGKGAPAARLTALARYTIRAAAIRNPDLKRDLTDLSDALLRQSGGDARSHERRFVTAAVLRMRVEDRDVVVSAGCGGHPPPLVIRRDGDLDELECRGPLLGVFPDVRFVTDDARLRVGDVLIVYTDGVTEARRGREQFGLERLRHTLRTAVGKSPVEVVNAVGQALRNFQAGDLARDDTALLAISPRAAPPDECVLPGG